MGVAALVPHHGPPARALGTVVKRPLCAGPEKVNAVPLQVDPRLPPEAQERVRARMVAMVRRQRFDGAKISGVLARAYHDVTRRRILCAEDL